MSRTYRCGKPGNNIHAYQEKGAIKYATEGFYLSNGVWLPSWRDTYIPNRGYKDYLVQSISEFHRDGKSDRNVPRDVRKLDVRKQKTVHIRAIKNAWVSGDWDVVLDPLRKDASWNYW